jgi:hypothetical protein
MDVGIGLPNAVPDTEGRTLVDQARRASEAGLSTLGTIGRLDAHNGYRAARARPRCRRWQQERLGCRPNAAEAQRSGHGSA